MARKKKTETTETTETVETQGIQNLDDLTSNIEDVVNLEELNVTEIEAANEQREKELELLEELEDNKPKTKNGTITPEVIENKGEPKDGIEINRHKTKPKMPSAKERKKKDSGVRSTLGLFYR